MRKHPGTLLKSAIGRQRVVGHIRFYTLPTQHRTASRSFNPATFPLRYYHNDSPPPQAANSSSLLLCSHLACLSSSPTKSLILLSKSSLTSSIASTFSLRLFDPLAFSTSRLAKSDRRLADFSAAAQHDAEQQKSFEMPTIGVLGQGLELEGKALGQKAM